MIVMFIVMKSKAMAFGEEGWTYSLIHSPFDRASVISRQMALDIIKGCGLTLAHRDRMGKIYDTPDRAFFNKYSGCRRAGWRVDEEKGITRNEGYGIKQYIRKYGE